MKLVKIEDVRVGQIWTFNNGKTYDIVVSVNNINNNLEQGLYEVVYEIWGDFNHMKGEKETADNIRLIDVESCKKDESATSRLLGMFREPEKYLIGFLNITHKLEDNKLIEVPREEFEVDDIIQNKWESEGILNLIVHKKNDMAVICKIYPSHYFVNSYFNINSEEDLKMFFSSRKNRIELSETNRVGILGVNYEFINEKLSNNNNK
jgi:hypothetical protein